MTPSYATRDQDCRYSAHVSTRMRKHHAFSHIYIEKKRHVYLLRAHQVPPNVKKKRRFRSEIRHQSCNYIALAGHVWQTWRKITRLQARMMMLLNERFYPFPRRQVWKSTHTHCRNQIMNTKHKSQGCFILPGIVLRVG